MDETGRPDERIRRRIRTTLAMSLDGFIADPEGGYGWIRGSGPCPADTKEQWDYGSFLEGIDTVVMGRRCHEQGMSDDFPGKEVLVAVGSPRPDEGPVRFLWGDVADQVAELRSREGGDLFLFGGGLLLRDFIERDLVDEYVIGIIPVILGKGIPLFHSRTAPLELELKDVLVGDGIPILFYGRRRKA